MKKKSHNSSSLSPHQIFPSQQRDWGQNKDNNNNNGDKSWQKDSNNGDKSWGGGDKNSNNNNGNKWNNIKVEGEAEQKRGAGGREKRGDTEEEEGENYNEKKTNLFLLSSLFLTQATRRRSTLTTRRSRSTRIFRTTRSLSTATAGCLAEATGATARGTGEFF